MADGVPSTTNLWASGVDVVATLQDPARGTLVLLDANGREIAA